MTVYAASKFAVHAISDGYREELTPHRVRTTVIAPGYVATPIFRTDEHDTAVSRDFDDRSRRRGMPVERVAEAVVQALATPIGTMQYEIALLSLDQ
jgi:NADP-dependent 3-hydroxy acid dehydrogenase YdfG